MPNGRPSKYTKAVGEEICQRIAAGESLLKICKDDHLPHRSTVHDWLIGVCPTGDSFSDNYAQARIKQADVYFEEVMELAREATQNPSSEKTQAIKLLTDNQKWVLARMDKRKFGESSSLELTGDKDNPVEVRRRSARESMTDEEVEAAQKLAHAALQKGAGQ